jgi:hypothetical protein
MPCVFDKATENLSDEHVFPAFTGVLGALPLLWIAETGEENGRVRFGFR